MNVEKIVENKLLLASARVLTVLISGLAIPAVIYVASTLGRIETEQVKQSSYLEYAVTGKIADHGKRIDRLENRVFGMGATAAEPPR